MKLSFVIPAYNEELYLGKCLDSITRELEGGNYDAEIIVVDNASADRTKEVAAKYPGVKVVSEPRKGLVWTRRAGFLAATGDLIANVDADTMLTSGWIQKVLREFSQNPKLVALSGPFIYYDLPQKVTFFVKFFYYAAFVTYLLNRFIFNLSSMLQGGNIIVRRSALISIGGYNTDINFYGEDTDLARRLHKVGPVKFTFRLPIYSSGRRLAKEGTLSTALRYGLNYFWIIFFKKPFSDTSIDVRPEHENGKLKYRPSNRAKEWTIAATVVMVFIGIFSGFVFLAYTAVKSGFFGYFTIAEIKAETKKMSDKINIISDSIGRSIRIKTNGVSK